MAYRLSDQAYAQAKYDRDQYLFHLICHWLPNNVLSPTLVLMLSLTNRASVGQKQERERASQARKPLNLRPLMAFPVVLGSLCLADLSVGLILPVVGFMIRVYITPIGREVAMSDLYLCPSGLAPKSRQTGT